MLVLLLGFSVIGLFIGYRKGYPFQCFLIFLLMGYFIPWFLWWIIPLLVYYMPIESEKAKKRREEREWRKWQNERADYYRRIEKEREE